MLHRPSAAALVTLLLTAMVLVACGADPGPLDGSATDGGPCTGTACTDPCAANPCMEAHTVCVAEGTMARCECEPGHHSVGAMCEPDGECLDTTCSSHGTCALVDGTPSCTCDAGYVGDYCDGCGAGLLPDGRGGCSATPCEPNPCSDPGRERCEATDTGPVCDCSAGTHDEGGECVPDATCMPSTCNDHGTCSMGSDGLTCACDDGWAGVRCGGCDESGGYHPDGAGGCTTDVCVPSPCTEPMRSVCVAEPTGPRCDCDAGTHDEGGACVTDETCAPDSCSMHGTCAVTGGRRACTCDAGYVDAACASCDAAGGYHDDGAGGCTTDACVPSPCVVPNRSVCTSDATGATCACDAGYHDDGVGGCTTDPCTPDPCAASGQACRVGSGGLAECYTPVCDDINPCTSDAFSGGVCVHTPVTNGTACSTSICTASQTCTAGVCGGGSPVSCADTNPCTSDSCVDPTGCVHTNDDTLIPSDGVLCTVDACSAGVASHVASSALCDDGLFCDGVETCTPASPSADANGCVRSAPPAPPGPSSPCRSYAACDEATDSFPLTVRSAGASCDDGISCTSGDVCVATGGACAGTPIAGCTGAACTTTSAFPGTIAIMTASITGAITLDGGAIPASLPAAVAYDAQIYARAKDTGELHLIAAVDYDYSSSGTYPLRAGTDAIATRLIPGIYDIVYRRGLSSTATPRYVYQTSPSDPFAQGFRVLISDRVIGPGDNTLDVDIPTGSVTGAITLDGGAIPTSLPAAVAYDTQLYAVSRDTGELHLIGAVDYDYSSSGTYPLRAGTDAIATRLIPGTYDILYRRGLSSTATPRYVYQTSPSDPFAQGYRLLQSGVIISSGANTLNVNITTGSVTGAITLDGGAIPTSLPASVAYDTQLYAVSRDTGELHLIAAVDYDYSSSGTYPLRAGTDAIATRLIPGTYDILYRRGLSSTADPRYVYQTSPSDPFAQGYRLLQSGVIISSGANTLNVNITTGSVTGAITLDGGAIPASLPASVAYDTQLYAVSRDTGELHLIAAVDYDYSSSGTYPLRAGTDAIATRLIPGTYDILYRRGLSSTATPRYVYQTSPSDPFAQGYRLLQSGVVISSGANTLNVNIPTGTVTGAITLDGGAIPSSLPASVAYDTQLYAVSRDTGELHLIAAVDYDYSSSGTYPLRAGTDAIATRLIPGTYDILYRRGLSSTADPRYVYQTSPADPFAQGYRLLQSGVIISSGANTLNVNIPTADLGAAITLDGTSIPSSLPASVAYDTQLYGVSRDTGELHLIGAIDYDYSSSGTYPLRAGTDVVDTRLIPGTYDLLYRRGLSSTATPRYVYQTSPSDPFAQGYRYLGVCLAVP